MRIGISGVQGSGKTTLINALMTLKSFENYSFKTNIVRDLKDKGFQINELGTDETQLAVCNAHLENLKLENMITDRCLIDCLAYTRDLYKNQKIKMETLNKIEKETKENFSRYDFVFLLLPEFDIKPDGIRNTSPEYVNQINQEFLKLSDEYGLKILKGETRQRISKMLKIITK